MGCIVSIAGKRKILSSVSRLAWIIGFTFALPVFAQQGRVEWEISGQVPPPTDLKSSLDAATRIHSRTRIDLKHSCDEHLLDLFGDNPGGPRVWSTVDEAVEFFAPKIQSDISNPFNRVSQMTFEQAELILNRYFQVGGLQECQDPSDSCSSRSAGLLQFSQSFGAWLGRIEVAGELRGTSWVNRSSANWNWHTVVYAKAHEGDAIWILDPLVSKKPLTFEAWVKFIARSPTQVRLEVAAHSLSPRR